ncbi:hypothetical protein [Hymenobacter crusticola]|uniref:Uncharacterized protein n=1 Tax=Hymenobacter crusticola TaxID=1770526 RepID=A0A243W600_9BACT|nr:hypothetical protein [Hymenobacter crusticola]OUJ69198.1 hypothetical protein BXP70_26790 [Hymenobacter crusticola]
MDSSTIVEGLLYAIPALVTALLGYVIVEAVKGTVSGTEARKRQKCQRYVAIAQQAVDRAELIPFLKWQYKHQPFLERAGFTYPVAIYPAPAQQKTKLASVLTLPLNKEPLPESEFIVKNATHLDILKYLDIFTLPPTVNTDTYVMHQLRADQGELRLDGGVGKYFDTHLTSESLEWELRSKSHLLKGTTEQDFHKFFQRLPLRKTLHAKVSNPVLDGTGRSNALGISTLIAYKDKNRDAYQLLTRRRAKKGVPLRSGLLHVVPGFMFQPTTTILGIEYEYDIRYNVLREYLEELFSVEENLSNDHPDIIYSDCRLQYLLQLFEQGKAALYFTGVAVNLLNLRPEICTLLVISSPEWYEKCTHDPAHYWKFNKEFQRINDDVRPKEYIGAFSLSTDEAMIETASLYPNRTVPVGAAAFWLGVDTLRELQQKPSSTLLHQT